MPGSLRPLLRLAIDHDMGKRKKSTRTPGAGRKKMPPLGTFHAC